MLTYLHSQPSGTIVPEQLNIKAVTGACKLIDGYSLSFTVIWPQFKWYQLEYATEIKSIQKISIAISLLKGSAKDSILYYYYYYY